MWPFVAGTATNEEGLCPLESDADNPDMATAVWLGLDWDNPNAALTVRASATMSPTDSATLRKTLLASRACMALACRS